MERPQAGAAARFEWDILADGDVRGLLQAARRAAHGSSGNWVPPATQEVAHMLPQYGIEELIGRGGMGAVYRGVQKSLGRPVAVKILPHDLEEEPMNFEERFRREARALARLSHPGIVTLLDAGTTPQGLLFLVMEFAEGASVERMLGESRCLGPVETRDIAIQICEALQAAHEAGIIHRDVKPSNVIVDSRGRVKLVDFGLARPMDREGRFTQSNFLIGTPEFLAPEASLGMKDMDHRADIYSLGVMLYQMLTGRVPRGAAGPPSDLREGLISAFDTIVSKAMRHDRAERYADALEMLEDLRAIQTTAMDDTVVS